MAGTGGRCHLRKWKKIKSRHFEKKYGLKLTVYIRNVISFSDKPQIRWNSDIKGVFINTLVGGGLGKMEGGQKSFELPKGGDQKVFSSKWGGSKKFDQIESIMKIKMHNLLPKSTGYSLKLDLYFKIFPGPSAGPALHLTLKMPLLAQLQVHLAFV